MVAASRPAAVQRAIASVTIGCKSAWVNEPAALDKEPIWAALNALAAFHVPVTGFQPALPGP